ncbi:hypothetical protein K2Z84_05225 [Candidatus Binatia bacterium]|nr:hypothetical protein [Candidatus Binatia bacterium]
MRWYYSAAMLAALLFCSQADARPLVFTGPGGDVHQCAFRPGAKPAVLDCSDGNAPTPVPTAIATPSPVPTAIDERDLCPDGTLQDRASNTDPWYGVTAVIKPGEVKRYCAKIQPPLIPFYPRQITFSWYETSDQDCGALNVGVDALSGPPRPRGGAGYSASGNFYYYGKSRGRDGSVIQTPEQTAPGIYVVTVIGGGELGTTCVNYRIAWKAEP